MSASDRHELDELLEYLREQRSFDVTGYKRPNLERRLGKRMSELGVESYGKYREYLETHPDEFSILFDTILINVTGFFRDPESWNFLAEEAVPKILAAKASPDPVRVWVAGCATGEEAYTLAMLFAEAMGEESFLRRVRIYASDLDQGALAMARLGAYRPEALERVPEALRGRYFEETGTRRTFRPEFRRSVVFGALDLVRDAPISHVDLISCRNTLMYFNSELQNRILARFHFALNDPGFLFLGKAEMLLRQGDLFSPTNLKFRLYRKVPKPDIHDRAYVLARSSFGEASTRAANQERLREEALQANAYAQVVVDMEGRMTLINDRARAMFGLTREDRGRLFQDVELSYRPLELRSLIEEVKTAQKARKLPDVERTMPEGGLQFLDVTVAPVAEADGRILGVNLTFLDVTENHRLREDLRRSKQELETAYEELQSTNEELETTNEELQSTVEELETTNEELQSTNEELQTMNEELQSSNEELHTINVDMQEHSDALLEKSAFLESLMRSLQMAVAVVNRNLEVSAWNPRAEDLWGLRGDEALGKSLLALDIGLPVVQIEDRIRACLDGPVEQEATTVEATNRRGQRIDCRVSCMPLKGSDGSASGVIVLMEQAAPRRRISGR